MGYLKAAKVQRGYRSGSYRLQKISLKVLNFALIDFDQKQYVRIIISLILQFCFFYLNFF